MNRSEFLARIRKLLDDMEVDHEEHTGIEDTYRMPFESWMIEIQSVQNNTL